MLLLLIAASLLPMVYADGPKKTESYTLGPVDFDLKNDTREDRGHISVRAKGEVSLELEVSETGEGRTRRLQTLVAIYEKPDSKSLRVGKLVKEHLATEMMLADQSGTVVQKQSISFDAPEGDYIAYVFFCDPDSPVRRSPGNKALADQLKLPGNPRRMQLFLAHVEPLPVQTKVAPVPPSPPAVDHRP